LWHQHSVPAALRFARLPPGSFGFAEPSPGSVLLENRLRNILDEIPSHTTHERLHDENQPRNVVLFAGDVGLNTYLARLVSLISQEALHNNQQGLFL